MRRWPFRLEGKLVLSGKVKVALACCALTVALAGATPAVAQDFCPGASATINSVTEGTDLQVQVVVKEYNGTSCASSTIDHTGPHTVFYTTTNGSATGGSDFTVTTGSIMVSAGGGSALVNIPTTADMLYEGSAETLTFEVTSITGPGNNLGTLPTVGLTINDGDAVPTVEFSAGAQSNDESVSPTVTATLSHKTVFAVTAPFTLSGSATEGSGKDYEASAGQFSIAAQALSAFVTLTVNDDAIDEDPEDMILTLGAPANATLGTTTVHTATIQDNDVEPNASFTADVQSGVEGAGNMTVTVTLDRLSERGVVVPYALSGSASQGALPNDYTISPANFTFGATSASESVTITVNDDGADENDETVVLTMGAPTNAGTTGFTTHTATIQDDDVPQVSFDAATSSGDESNSPSLDITISPTPINDITLNFSYGGTASGGDYAASTTLMVTAGTSSTTLPITITGDSEDEADEAIVVTIAAGTGYAPSGQTTHEYTILDDDADLSISKSAGATFNADDGTLTYTIQVNNTSTTTDATGVTVTDAKLGSTDYSAVASAQFVGTTWSGLSIASGGMVTATVAATLGVEHTVTNTALITAADQADDDAGNSTVTITVNQYDYGDVPATYTAATRSARHEILSGGPRLGPTVDSDSGNQASATASGDDGDADGDDEDGIAVPPTIYALGATELVTVNVDGAGGFIHMWIDFNADGEFTQAADYIGVTAAPATGDYVIAVTPPSGSAGETFARVRVCSVTTYCDDPEEDAADGEVEDYPVKIVGMDYGDAPSANGYRTKKLNDGARHGVEAPITHYMGVQLDIDLDAQDTPADATGDDVDGADDEDGVTFLSSLMIPASGSTIATADVQVVGSGVLYAWIDLNIDGTFDDASEEVITAAPLNTGLTTVQFTIPSGTGVGASFARFRYCDSGCDKPFGYVAKGEVEDYAVDLVNAASTPDVTVTLPSGTNVTGTITLSLTGTTLTLGDGTVTLFEAPAISGMNSLTIEGLDTDNLLLVDLAGGVPIPTGGVVYNAGDGDDELRIDLQNQALTSGTITFNGGDPTTGPGDFLTIQNSTMGATTYDFLSIHTDEDSGNFLIDDDDPVVPGAFDDLNIIYDGLEPIFFTATPAKAIFQFNDDDNTINLNGSGDAGGLGDGFSFIDCVTCGEDVTFTTPTDSLIVRPGGGDDTITFPNLDVAGAVMLNVLIQGESGNDRFIVTPSPFYDPHIMGEDPVLPRCYGDILDIVTEGGITDHSLVYERVGTGKWTFTAASNQDVTFDSIESQLDARTEISVGVTASANEFYPTDPITLTYSVTNNGIEHATCVIPKITIPDAVSPTQPIVPSRGIYYDGSPPTLSLPTLDAPEKWVIPWLQSGVTATMEVTGIMDAHIQDVYYALLKGIVPPDSTENAGLVISVDTVATDNADSVRVSLLPTFPFPAKGHGVAALQVNLPNGLERVLVGLSQGSPGLNTGVLCRIPDPDGVLFTQVGVGNRWRPCGTGLPHPVYVTDLFLDSRGTPADSTDDWVWAATWGSEGLYYSTDFGETFASAAAVFPGETPGWTTVYAIEEDASGIIYLSANTGTVYRSFDRGASWQKVTSLPGASADLPWSLTAHPTEPGVLYAGVFGRGVYHTEDYGFTWEPLGRVAVNDLLIDASGGHVFDLEFSPDSNEYLFAGTGRGVYRITLDAGGTVVSLWDELDVRVTLDNGTVVTPEIRTLAFDPDEEDVDDDLLVGSWGFGAFEHTAPITVPSRDFVEFALKEGYVSMLLPLQNGDILLGNRGGGVEMVPSAGSVTSTTIEPVRDLPTAFALAQNYPNPFNPSTTIGFDVPTTGRVHLAVYDVLGREVAVLVSDVVEAGRHRAMFDAGRLTSGTYLYRLQTEAGAFTRQLVLMK
ncbi:MAG: T9SS type A sorting domain-containing protein [Rhodothermales bacterium]|nr:T9SS type A sorting domain-containing protein [Rhodothermales bacterium]MBO6779703.1 T9SS type A sorting domain-containing protein [Rhodothermales bacterium]